MTLALLEKQLITFKTDEIKLTAGFNKREERVLESRMKTRRIFVTKRDDYETEVLNVSRSMKRYGEGRIKEPTNSIEPRLRINQRHFTEGEWYHLCVCHSHQ